MSAPVTQPAGPIGVLAHLSDEEWADLLRDFETAPEAREVAADVHQVLGDPAANVPAPDDTRRCNRQETR
jgi:hypothetical protein